MKLYDDPLSGNCHKVRMMLRLLRLPHEIVPVPLKDRAHKRPEFLKINPLGKVPVLEDGDLVVRDSQAILVYLARKYDPLELWLPGAPAEMATVMQWLAFAANDMWLGPAMARAVLKFGRDYDLPTHQGFARTAMEVLEARLEDHDWLALDRPTIGDIACYPYAALVWEGEIPLDPYPACRDWFARIHALPGYVSMEGMD